MSLRENIFGILRGVVILQPAAHFGLHHTYCRVSHPEDYRPISYQKMQQAAMQANGQIDIPNRCRWHRWKTQLKIKGSYSVHDQELRECKRCGVCARCKLRYGYPSGMTYRTYEEISRERMLKIIEKQKKLEQKNRQASKEADDQEEQQRHKNWLSKHQEDRPRQINWNMLAEVRKCYPYGYKPHTKFCKQCRHCPSCKPITETLKTQEGQE